ncbi:PPE domain-containing protein, partial [Mycobacterium avium]|uniref:PPE domain-containing protein n=1 Tax=Mycobacterium avium TaxID=1764 RepID=UPI0011590047
MVLDFAAVPPEITSALMYAGAGSGPLMAAATAYANLSAEVSSTASQWESIISLLTTEQWTGGGSAAAAAAAQPIVSYLTTTAAALEPASAQATASAAAYEAAFAATV